MGPSATIGVLLFGAICAVIAAALVLRARTRGRATEAQLRTRLDDADRRDERLARREEALESLLRSIEQREQTLAERDRELARARAEVEELRAARTAALEELGGISAEDARSRLYERMEGEARRRASHVVADIEHRAREEAERRARDILCTAVQRLAVSTSAPATAVVLPLPDGEMKARIIGKEGRNIRAFEHATGVNLVVDELPDGVLLSCYDPWRREVARLALSDLVDDGRIHPSTIEAAVERAREDIHTEARQAALEAAAEVRVEGLHPELVRLLGALHYRNAYGHNVLRHAVETAQLGGLIANELGVDADIVRRAGLLHDIGKALPHDDDRGHARVGAEVADRYGESVEVCHAVETHHGAVEARTAEAVVVQSAVELSSSRPGARREHLEQYMSRLRRVEELCQAFEGVKRVHAMQAGRDVRVMVHPEVVGDDETRDLARRIAARIESELAYPGQVRLTVVRELRATEVLR